MKKFFTLLCVAFCATSLFANVVTGTCGDNLQWSYDTDTHALTITGSGDMYWSGERPWEQVAGEITSVSLPDGLTSIGRYAFYGCSSLTSITIPNSVASIGNLAFEYCSSLTSITIPNSVASIGGYAFDGTGIYNNESNWENDVLYIDNCLIDAKESISGTYTIKENTRLIAAYAFYNCSSLTSITIPEGVTSIGDYAFRGCSSLTTPVYNAHCFAYMPTSFEGAYTIPDGIKQIAGSAFYECSFLTSITIPESVTSIGSSAFYECSSLTSVIIPNSVTSIGSDAFQDCSSLTSVTIGNSVTSIGGEAFCNCTSLISITIPNSVTSIEELTFCQCSSLISVTIGNSVTSIDESAFVGCSSLTSMVVETGNSTYDSRENCNAIIETATNTLIAGCQNTIIPNSVTSIGGEAFSHCTSLTSIAIPNSVTNVGRNAFYYCSSLTSITIPSSVTSIEGESVFAGCIFVKENFINNSSLDAQANNYWGATIVDSETDGLIIRNDTVIRCRPNVISANIPANVTTIGDFAFYYCTSLTSITIPEGVTSIGGYAFDYCTSLTSVTIPNSVTTIGDFAFYYCTSLSSVTCLAMTPSAMGVLVFGECDNPTLFVLCNALSDYQAHKQWGQFANIECIGAEAVETEEVVIESGTTTISITWPTEESANTYTIVVKKTDEVVCTLIFNADGQLINATFAPGRNGNRPAQYAEQVADGSGFRFTVTGLEEGTDYTYEIVVKDELDNTISNYSGEFSTQSNISTATDNIHTESTTQKILRNGQLLIIRDGKTYNIMGQEL